MVVLRPEKIWYVKHSGFGLGLERLILFITGMNNIRDIPFPRTPKTQVLKYITHICTFILVIEYA